MAKKAKAEPQTVTDLRCWRCNKLLAEVAPPGTSIRCLRCGARSMVPDN